MLTSRRAAAMIRHTRSRACSRWRTPSTASGSTMCCSCGSHRPPWRPAARAGRGAARRRRFPRLDRRRRLRTYRHAPNTGPRKSWAAGDATARGVGWRCSPTRRAGESFRAFRAALGLSGRAVRGPPCARPPLGSYVMDNVLFKVSVPPEFHAQTAAECALHLHPQVRDRIGGDRANRDRRRRNRRSASSTSVARCTTPPTATTRCSTSSSSRCSTAR